MRFTVITAVCNGAATLAQLIDSVAGQTYRQVELVVQDGGSTDGTIELLESRAAQLAHWESLPDTGIYQAWNRALVHARGDWVVFLGVDDYLFAPDVIERVARELRTLPDSVEVAYGRLAVVTRDGRPVETLGMPWLEVCRPLRAVMCVPHPATFYRGAVFDRLGGFDESFRVAGDYEFLLRALKGRDAYFIADVIVTAMRVGGVSSDPTRTFGVLGEVYRARRKNLSAIPSLRWGFAVARAFVRRALWQLLGERRARRCLDLLRKLAGRAPYWTPTG